MWCSSCAPGQKGCEELSRKLHWLFQNVLRSLAGSSELYCILNILLFGFALVFFKVKSKSVAAPWGSGVWKCVEAALQEGGEGNYEFLLISRWLCTCSSALLDGSQHTAPCSTELFMPAQLGKMCITSSGWGCCPSKVTYAGAVSVDVGQDESHMTSWLFTNRTFQ